MTRDVEKVLLGAIEALGREGFKLVKVDNGGDWPESVRTEAEAIKLINETDESRVVFEAQGGTMHWFQVVMGLAPNETIADWVMHRGEPKFDAILTAYVAKLE
jgi:hypothetical protein